MYNQYMGYQPNMAGYTSPYQVPQMAQMPQTRQFEIVHVNGENGARAFRMSPNSQCLLLDDTAPIVWLCQSDGAGYHTVTPYTIAPYQATPAPDYASLESRVRRLEEAQNEPHVADAKQSGPNGAVSK